TKFLNKTLHAYFASKGILHQTSVARTPEQNSIVERWNRTLVEAARIMLSVANVPLFFWAKAIATLVEIVLFMVDFGCSKHMMGNLKLLINFVEKFLGTVKFGNDQIAPILGYGDLLVEIVPFIVDSGCSKHMTGNLKILINFVEKFLGTVKFRNDQIAPILGYGDLSTCYIRDLKGNDLLTCSRGTDLYSITLQDINSPKPICFMAKETLSQSWLWHHRLSHLNFDTINLLSKNDIVVGLPKLKFIKDHLCSSCELGKAKRKSFHTKITPSSKR
nr:hypothetical protein [Tanacetum cinerariifolium]